MHKEPEKIVEYVVAPIRRVMDQMKSLRERQRLIFVGLKEETREGVFISIKSKGNTSRTAGLNTPSADP